MLKRNLIFLFIIFLSKFTYGQMTIKTNKRYPPISFSSNIIDKVKNNIYYDYTCVKNPKSKNHTKNSITVLQIGEKFSKFTDYYTLKLDSIQERQSSLESVGTTEINEQLKYRSFIVLDKNIFRDIKNRKTIFQGKVYNQKYEYQSETQTFNWELKTDKKNIFGYKTQKAIINFAGRNWVAWFTNDIAISTGPYIFGGLPGLILELYDTQKNFHFVITGIDKGSKNIYKRNDKKIILTSKEEYTKAEKNFHKRPGLFIDISTRGVDNFKSIPYNPIELTDK